MVRSLVEVATYETIPNAAGRRVWRWPVAGSRNTTLSNWARLYTRDDPRLVKPRCNGACCRRWRYNRRSLRQSHTSSRSSPMVVRATAASSVRSGCRTMRSTRTAPRRRWRTMVRRSWLHARTEPSSPAENNSRRCASWRDRESPLGGWYSPAAAGWRRLSPRRRRAAPARTHAVPAALSGGGSDACYLPAKNRISLKVTVIAKTSSSDMPSV